MTLRTLALLIATLGTAFGQQTHDSLSVIIGKVVDDLDRRIQEPQVILYSTFDTTVVVQGERKTPPLAFFRNPATGFKVLLQTHLPWEDGTFRFTQLPQDTYTMIVVASGYVPWMRERIRVDGRDTARLVVRLEKEHAQSDTVFYDSPMKADLDGISQQLREFNEQPLFSLIDTLKIVESYRLLWIRHSHHPIMVRLDYHKDGAVTSYLKELDGTGGWGYGKMHRVLKVDVLEYYSKLTNDEKLGTDLSRLVQEAVDRDFWSSPFSIDTRPYTLVIHGSAWILEGTRRGHRHVIVRATPGPNDPIYQLGMRMLQPFNLEFKSGEVY